MNRVKVLAALAVFLAGAAPDEFQFRHGPLELSFDAETGRLSRIALGGETLAVPPPGAAPVSFAVGPADKTLWLVRVPGPLGGDGPLSFGAYYRFRTTRYWGAPVSLTVATPPLASIVEASP